MPDITLPDVDEETVLRLGEAASLQGLSVSAFILQVIRKVVGMRKETRRPVYTDLDHLAGTWSADEASAFLESLSDFEKVDDQLWR